LQSPALFIFFLSASILHAENTAPLPRVSIIPFINAKQLEEYEVLCSTATETIELTLQLIGSYDVIPPVAANPYTNPEILFEYSDEAGQMVFQASVYDTVQGKVTLTEERTAETILDTLKIIEDEIYSVPFSIPALTPAEEEELSAFRTACRVNRKPSRFRSEQHTGRQSILFLQRKNCMRMPPGISTPLLYGRRQTGTPGPWPTSSF
jgi:hypothetical protein